MQSSTRLNTSLHTRKNAVVHVVRQRKQRLLRLLGSSSNRAALVEGAILHAALVHASDDVEIALVAPRGGPRVGNGPVLKKESQATNPKNKP